MLELNKTELSVHAVKQLNFISPYLVGLFLLILIPFYFNCQTKKKILKTNLKGTRSTIQSPKFPTVTHWLPFQVPIFDGIITLLRFGNRVIVAQEELQRRFGKIYWIHLGNFKSLVVNDVDIIQKILSSNQPEHLSKPNDIYDKFFIHWLRDGLVNTRFPAWSVQRKVLNNCFTYNYLQNYLKSVNKHGKCLIRSLLGATTKNGEHEQIVDTTLINNTIQYHLVRVISDIVMGTASLPNEKADEFARNFSAFKPSLTDQLLNPFIGLPLVRYFNTKLTSRYEAYHYMDKFFNEITNMYRTKHELEIPVIKISSQDLHDSSDGGAREKPFRCLIQEMLSQGATNKEITNEVATFMIAGHETTNMALQFLMLHMALNPVHQYRCREEVDGLISQIVNAGSNRDDELGYLDFSMSNLASLKYLERCVLESARLAPVVPAIARALDAPLKISDDFEISAGTKVGIPVRMVHRDPTNFPNPEKFDPDRFLPENIKNRHPYSFIPFSGGMRNCIGWKLALMELKLILAWILRYFEIFSSDKLEDVPLLFGITLQPERNFNVILKRRP